MQEPRFYRVCENTSDAVTTAVPLLFAALHYTAIHDLHVLFTSPLQRLDLELISESADLRPAVRRKLEPNQFLVYASAPLRITVSHLCRIPVGRTSQ